MQYTMKSLILVAVLLPAASAQASCGGAYCTLSTDWVIQGMASKPGVVLDVRAEFIDLDELRHGTHKTQPSGEVGDMMKCVPSIAICWLLWIGTSTRSGGLRSCCRW